MMIKIFFFTSCSVEKQETSVGQQPDKKTVKQKTDATCIHCTVYGF